VGEIVYGIPNLEEALLDLLDAIGKGFALCEIVWEVTGGQARVSELRWIPQKKVTFGEDWKPRLLTPEASWQGIMPPVWKAIYHRYKARSGHATRSGVLRVVGWMYLLKNFALKDWAAFNEVFGMPLRLGKYDNTASPADREALVQAIRNLGSDAAGVISKSTEIEFVEAASRSGGANPYQLMADFCNREMSKAVLGQTLTTDTTGSTGTYAAASVHAQVRRDLVEADAQALATTLREQLLRPLVGFNFGWDKPVPWFRFRFEAEEDLKTLSMVYRNLAAMGKHLPEDKIREIEDILFSTERPVQQRFFEGRGVNFRTGDIELWPTEYYLCGGHGMTGIFVNEKAETTLPGLYAAGDVSLVARGHLSGAFVYGEIAAEEATEYSRKNPPSKSFDPGRVETWRGDLTRRLGQTLGEVSIEEFEYKTRRLISDYCTPPKNSYKLNMALWWMDRLQKDIREKVRVRSIHDVFKVLEVENIMLCAKLSATASEERKESRWGFWHYRPDYPKKDDAQWLKHIMLKKGADPEEIRVSHRPIAKMQ
jgi:hypothetical protein